MLAPTDPLTFPPTPLFDGEPDLRRDLGGSPEILESVEGRLSETWVRILGLTNEDARGFPPRAVRDGAELLGLRLAPGCARAARVVRARIFTAVERQEKRDPWSNPSWHQNWLSINDAAALYVIEPLLSEAIGPEGAATVQQWREVLAGQGAAPAAGPNPGVVSGAADSRSSVLAQRAAVVESFLEAAAVEASSHPGTRVDRLTYRGQAAVRAIRLGKDGVPTAVWRVAARPAVRVDWFAPPAIEFLVPYEGEPSSLDLAFTRTLTWGGYAPGRIFSDLGDTYGSGLSLPLDGVDRDWSAGIREMEHRYGLDCDRSAAAAIAGPALEAASMALRPVVEVLGEEAWEMAPFVGHRLVVRPRTRRAGQSLVTLFLGHAGERWKLIVLAAGDVKTPGALDLYRAHHELVALDGDKGRYDGPPLTPDAGLGKLVDRLAIDERLADVDAWLEGQPPASFATRLEAAGRVSRGRAIDAVRALGALPFACGHYGEPVGALASVRASVGGSAWMEALRAADPLVIAFGGVGRDLTERYRAILVGGLLADHLSVLEGQDRAALERAWHVLVDGPVVTWTPAIDRGIAAVEGAVGPLAEAPAALLGRALSIDPDRFGWLASIPWSEPGARVPQLVTGMGFRRTPADDDGTIGHAIEAAYRASWRVPGDEADFGSHLLWALTSAFIAAASGDLAIDERDRLATDWRDFERRALTVGGSPAAAADA